MLSIGALSQATGIPVETLRTWERRYGFPPHLRGPSGHRLYEPQLIPRLKRAKADLERGLRPGQLFPEAAREVLFPAGVDAWLELAFRGAEFSSALSSAHASLGLTGLATGVVVPLLERLGDAWERGTLSVAQEHDISGCVRACLEAAWRPKADIALGPLALVAGLSGERHELGFHLAAAVLAEKGWRIHFLGPDTPLEELQRSAVTLGVDGLFLSVSQTTKVGTALSVLGEELGAKMPIVAGGKGATPALGVLLIQDLERFSVWAADQARAWQKDPRRSPGS